MIDLKSLDNKLNVMIRLQSKMNSTVDPNWMNNENDWHLAAGMEAAEAIDHYGWKWWKKSEPNMPMLKNELVDIWHFVLSFAIEDRETRNLYEAICQIASGDSIEFAMHCKVSVIRNMKMFAAGCFTGDMFNLACFFAVMKDVGLTFDELYFQYVGKNVLNIFRQAHGYKSGTYIKDWDGYEDNHHMMLILESIRDLQSDSDFDQILYEALENRYKQLSEVI